MHLTEVCTKNEKHVIPEAFSSKPFKSPIFNAM